MERKLVVLQLVLKELGVPLEIDSLDKRVLIQKGVYLVQRAGVDLNYRYTWYVKGPYSTELTKDYYRLQDGLESEPSAADSQELRPDLIVRIGSVKSLLAKPDGFQLSQADWVELLASLDYAIKVRGSAEAEAARFVGDEKPRLANYVEMGMQALRSCSLLK